MVYAIVSFIICVHVAVIHFSGTLGDIFVISWVTDAIFQEKFLPPFALNCRYARFGC